jgi:hypothetical protein
MDCMWSVNDDWIEKTMSLSDYLMAEEERE